MQTIIVENDKHVTVDGLHQWLTYGGLVEGIPTDIINRRILDRLKGEALRYGHTEAIHIIEPSQTELPYDGDYRFGKPMVLPSVTCIARLSHSQPARDPKKHCSQLTLVWFQNDYAFPVDPGIQEVMKQVLWAEIAEDCYY